MTKVVVCAALVAVVVSVPGAPVARAAAGLSGAWELNRDLSSPPGGLPGGGDGGGRGDGGRRGPGGGGRGPGGGGVGGGGFGGGRGGPRGPGGRPGGERPSKEDMDANRALLGEVMDLPSRVTIIQDGAKVIVTEPDGVVRTYLVNGKAEKHQLTNGTIETKSSWDGPSLVMQITIGRAKIERTFTVRDDPRRLEVATGFDRGPKDARRLHVYDEALSQR
ncbi:MAG: hypothetical protein IT181_16070 [Acidobacteria bacterium]|nr:hypothetical protein [Acidobacteriota bacterium]